MKIMTTSKQVPPPEHPPLEFTYSHTLTLSDDELVSLRALLGCLTFSEMEYAIDDSYYHIGNVYSVQEIRNALVRHDVEVHNAACRMAAR